MPSPLPLGLYEQVITTELAAQLASLERDHYVVERAPVDQAEAHLVLARHLSDALAHALASVRGEEHERLHAQVDLSNRVLAALRGTAARDELAACATVAPGPAELLAVLAPRTGGIAASAPPQRPGIPLNVSALLTNARDEHRIGHELRRELTSADAVDLLCSFVKWSGLRVVEDALRALRDRGARLRVLTTAYLGATEGRALDALARMGAEVRVSYDTRRTRLHAKAWLFHRDTGYSTAYIGSSNLSSAALLDGLEWNVRVSRAEVPDVLTKFAATFESYWEDPEFEPYDPAVDRARFDLAARAEQRGEVFHDALLEVRPFPHQQEILDRLLAERELHGRWRNLVVAATGTGKTVVAALDYRRVWAQRGSARLLFVAHRKEILEQSLRTFRAVMRDGAFGELWVDGHRPVLWSHVFASIQTLAGVDLADLPADAFDVVVVDEFHHAGAASYERLLTHLRPALLLGLTATPERADGVDVLHWFGGRVAAELRLWDALERGLLCPFQYFGVHDNVSLAGARWTRGSYETAALDNLYTGNHARVRLVVQALRDKVADPRAMRALGFCASIAHARFMAAEFTRVGIPSLAVSAESPAVERDGALRRLRDREVNVLFAVDLFNEGIDVPEIDTALLLRPTESATVFLQQLGRGLRLADGKACLTALDFIGQAHENFRFDVRYRALVGGTRQGIERRVEEGFPYLPPGCVIQFDREASRVVLENVRRSIRRGARHLLGDFIALQRELGCEPSLREFMEATGLSLEELYRQPGRGWSWLRREAGAETRAAGDDELRLARAVGRTLHVDDPERLSLWRELLARDKPPSIGELDARRRTLLTMLHFDLWATRDAPGDLHTSMARLWQHPAVVDELRAVFACLEDELDHVTFPLDSPESVPLRVHARYSRDEALAAFGALTPERPTPIREGVFFHEATGCDLLFVTLRKSEKEYSPRTMYRDFAISPAMFHWESQSTTAADSKAGRRYREARKTTCPVVLFVREARHDERGVTTLPYVFLGAADYVRHEGERPMAITWRLRRAMPASLYRDARLAAA